MGADL